MFPKQTESNWSHIRGYGCCVSTLLSFTNLDLTPLQVEKYVRYAITQGWVIDNNTPILKDNYDDWYRVFARNQDKFIEGAGMYFGKKCTARETFRIGSTKNPCKLTSLDSIGHANRLMLEYDSDGIMGGNSHFVSGVPASGSIMVNYNPDPTIPLKYLISVRGWLVDFPS